MKAVTWTSTLLSRRRTPWNPRHDRKAPTGPQGPPGGGCVPQNLTYAVRSNEISVIDQRTHQEIGIIPLPESVSGSAAFNPATGDMFFGAGGGGLITLWKFNVNTGGTESVAQGGISGSVEAAIYDPVTDLVYVNTNSSADGTLVFSGTPLEYITTIFPKLYSIQVDTVNGTAYGTNQSQSQIISATGAVVYTFPGGNYTVKRMALDSARHRLYVYIEGNEIFVFDTQDGAFIDSFAADWTGPAGDIQHFAVNPALNQLYAVYSEDLTTQVIDIYDTLTQQRINQETLNGIFPSFEADPATGQIFLYNNDTNTTDMYLPDTAGSLQPLGSIAMGGVNSFLFYLQGCGVTGPTGPQGASIYPQPV